MAPSQLDELRNLGALRLGAPVPPGEKTILIVGVARSGTSMVASVLRELGIFLGDGAQPPVLEDVRLASALESGDAGAVRDVVRGYDSEHQIWAYKRPALIRHLGSMEEFVRNPVYIVVFRDILAIANRNSLSMRSDPLKSMHQTLRQYDAIHEFLDRQRPTALLVSNEKALLRPEAFVDQVIDWLRLAVDEQRRDRAVAAIQVDSPQYLDAARLRFLGHLDKATSELISGWAHIQGLGGPAKVEIVVNGRTICTCVADVQRADVRKKGVHPTGFCGFRYEVRPGDGISSGDEVIARFVVGGQNLKGSPKQVA